MDRDGNLPMYNGHEEIFVLGQWTPKQSVTIVFFVINKDPTSTENLLIESIGEKLIEKDNVACIIFMK